LNLFILACTNYWKGWFRWRLMLIVVCHFVFSCVSFFDLWVLTTLWCLEALPTYQTSGSPRSGIIDLSQAWLPWLDIGDLSQVWLPWFEIGDRSQVWKPWLDIGDISQVWLLWLDIGDLSHVWLPWLDIGELRQVWLPWLDILIFLFQIILILWFTIFWLWVYSLNVIAETFICCVFFCDCSVCWYWRNCWPQFKISIHYHLKSLNIYKTIHWTYICMFCKFQHGIQ
jgi:hypothetical protein